MTKINNQIAFMPDTQISGMDYWIGSDADQNGRTVNFRVLDVIKRINSFNGQYAFDYLFYTQPNLPNPNPANGGFFSNENNDDPSLITEFYFSKVTESNKNILVFFQELMINNVFNIKISQQNDLNSVFYFEILEVIEHTNYFTVRVDKIYSPTNKVLIPNKSSVVVFELKESTLTLTFANIVAGLGYIPADVDDLFSGNHSDLNLDDGTNPHGTTQADVGLNEVNNTSDLNKPISNATQTALDEKADLVDGLVPSYQLPSFVDDVINGYLSAGIFYEDITLLIPITGVIGKIYIDLTSGQSSKQYRWSGFVYIQITNGLIASTNDVPEGGSNLYWTVDRGLALVLTGLSAASGTFTSSDTLLTAFGKIKYLIDNIATTYQAILTDVNFGSFINGLTGKTTPVDADFLPLMDSADSNKAKKLSIANLKALIYSVFATETVAGVVSTVAQSFGGNKIFVGQSTTVGNALEVQNSAHSLLFSIQNGFGVIIQSLGNTTGNKYITFGDSSGLAAREVYFERVATSGGGLRVRTAAGTVFTIDGLDLTYNTTGGVNFPTGVPLIQGSNINPKIIKTQVANYVFSFFSGSTTGAHTALTNLMYQIDTDAITAANRQFSIMIPLKVGNNTLNNASALLELESTTKGFLLPRQTTTQQNAIGTPATGLGIFNTTLDAPTYKSSTAWEQVVPKSYADRNQLVSFTVATLPASPQQGYSYAVTDALAPTYLGALIGGGTVYCPVVYNGTIWISC